MIFLTTGILHSTYLIRSSSLLSQLYLFLNFRMEFTLLFKFNLHFSSLISLPPPLFLQFLPALLECFLEYKYQIDNVKYYSVIAQ